MSTLFYCISILILGILFCILKRTEKKIDIIPMIIITFLCILAYQVLVCLIFSILNIKINIVNLGILNTLFCIYFTILIKQNGIQQFLLDKKDVIITLILILIVTFIAYKDVGNLENIRYSSTDASIHYIAAKEFYQNEQMLNKTENTETSKQMMPIAYVNVGILFKAFEKNIGEINLYKIFILFDITIFCFTGILFYFILKNKIGRKRKLILISIFISVVYLIGYPLNNLLSGFYYLGIGCLFINSIIYIMTLQKEKIEITRLILFLLNIGVILSYSLFAPVIYLSIFIYNGYETYKKYNKILNKQYIIDTIITLIIPGLIGVIFLILPDIETVKYISQKGYIYKNLFVNIIFFIPFSIYFLLGRIKNKKIDYNLIYSCILIMYMLILYIGTKVNVVSEYYFYKNSYILWTILLIYFFYGIEKFIREHKKQEIIVITYFTLYVFILTISIITNTHLLSIFNIYENNYSLICNKENLTQDDIDMLNYIHKNNILDKTKNNTLFIADFMQEAWIRSIFAYRNRNPLEKRNHYEYIEKLNKGEIKYLVCFERTTNYELLKNYFRLEEYELIFSTKNAKLYKTTISQ